jgi:hypothetical protein
MAEPEVVCLTTTNTLQEAHTLADALEREGIYCQVVGDYLTGVYGVGLPGMCLEVWVRRESLRKAQIILREYHRGMAAARGAIPSGR